ncbi:hypothetical protein FOVSG1_000827 [Fusarium oxysporum f. sp. vasinfectum]
MDTPNLSGPRTNTDTSPGLKKRGSLVFALPCLPFNPCFVCQFTSKRKTILAARQDEPSLARDNPPTPIQFNPPRSISKSAPFRTSLRLFIFTTSKPIIVNSIIVTISIGRITLSLERAQYSIKPCTHARVCIISVTKACHRTGTLSDWDNP